MKTIPKGKAEIIQTYGQPRLPNGRLDPKWAEKNLVFVDDLPFPLRLAWDTSVPVKRIRCHRLVAADLRYRLNCIWQHARAVVKKTHGYKLTTEFYDEQALKWLRAQGLDLYGGCLELRPKKGSARESTHSWGIAIDWDTLGNAYGTEGDLPQWWVDIWTTPNPKTGLHWTWGGNFPKSDPMHVQLCSGY